MDILEKIDLVLGEEVASSGVAIGTTAYGASTINLSLLNKQRKKKRKKKDDDGSGTTIYDIFRPD